MTSGFELLLTKLAPGAKSVHARVRLAIDDPETYAKKFRSKLEDRNAEDDPIDPWLQFVDALEDASLEWAVDWKASADDVVHALTQVLKKKKLKPALLTSVYDPGAHLSTRTNDFIAWCGRALSAHGLAVVSLDIESDSFELTVIPTKDLSELQRAAKKAGGAIISHAPKSPLTKPLPAFKPQAAKRFESFAVPRLWMHRDNYFRCPGVWSNEEKGTTLYDVRSWPPKKRQLGAPKLEFANSPRGHEVAHRVMHRIVDGVWSEEAEGTFLVTMKGKKPVELISKFPSGFDTHQAHFIEDLLVVFPTEPTIRGGKNRRPLVWNGKTFEPARGLPDARAKKGNRRDAFPSFLRMGVVETGKGEELLVWENTLWQRSAAGFRALKKPRLEIPVYDFFQGVAGPPGTRTFVHFVKDALHLTSLDDGSSRLLARFKNVRCDTPRSAGAHGVIVRARRSSNAKAPLLQWVHFDDREPTPIPASAFGVRSDDTVQAFGVTDDWLWIAHERAIKRLPLAAFR